MKGPYATYRLAKQNATDGEIILARNERYFPLEAWCTVSKEEADRLLHPYYCFEGWVHWENVRRSPA